MFFLSLRIGDETYTRNSFVILIQQTRCAFNLARCACLTLCCCSLPVYLVPCWKWHENVSRYNLLMLCLHQTTDSSLFVLFHPNSIQKTSILKVVCLVCRLVDRSDKAWIQTFYKSASWCSYFGVLLMRLLQLNHSKICLFWVHTAVVSQINSADVWPAKYSE